MSTEPKIKIKNPYNILSNIKAEFLSFSCDDDDDDDNIKLKIICQDPITCSIYLTLHTDLKQDSINFNCSFTDFISCLKACNDLSKDNYIFISTLGPKICIQDDIKLTNMLISMFPQHIANMYLCLLTDTTNKQVKTKIVVNFSVLTSIFNYIHIPTKLRSQTQGVFFSFTTNKLTASSTDGYRVYIGNFSCLASLSGEFFIHDTCLSYLKSFIKITSDSLEITLLSNLHCLFTLNNSYKFTCPITEEFISLAGLPSANTQGLVSQVNIDRISFITRGKKFIETLTSEFVIIRSTKHECYLQDQGGSTCYLDSNFSSKDIAFKINPKHLLSVVRNLQHPSFTFKVFEESVLIEEIREEFTLTYILSLFDF